MVEDEIQLAFHCIVFFFHFIAVIKNVIKNFIVSEGSVGG